MTGFIEDEKDEKNKSENNSIYNDDLLTQTDLILEESVNLKDPVFQEEDFIPCEFSTSDTSDKGNNNVESSSDIDLDPE
ncbi:21804_t:CDS:2, partial [Racocetra persica]